MSENDADLGSLSRSQLKQRCEDLQEKLDRTAKDVTVGAGTQIIKPVGMSWDEFISWGLRMKDEDETEIEFTHQICCHPLDGAFALLKAIKHQFGWHQLVPTPGFFGDTPPAMITMQIGPGSRDTIQVPWGRMKIPEVEGYIYTDYQALDGVPGFVIGAKIKKKNQATVYELAKLTEAIVARESVYHKKALSMNLKWIREGRAFDPRIDGFRFLSLDKVQEGQLIFDDKTARLLRTTLFVCIEHADKCRKMGVPLKRGILLEGPFGVGKTLTAYITAKKSVDNGFTFILVEDARDLTTIVQMAKKYEPCVLFCEDIDQVISGSRDITVDGLLNTIDGIQSKNSETIIVLSTNHAERIEKAMLRPGRLDTVIPMRAPKQEAVGKLIHYYAGNRLAPDLDLQKIATQLQGNIPATIREAVERAKMVSTLRNMDEGIEIDEPQLKTCDFEMAIEMMEPQLVLMKGEVQKPSELQDFAHILGSRISDGVKSGVHDAAKVLAKN